MIEEIVVEQKRFKLFFVESICDDPNLIESNIVEVKVSSPDYTNMNKEDALNDFRQRIEHYQEKYQPLHETNEKDYSYMKIYNTGEKIIIHKHEGHVQSRIVYFLMNIHISKRTIYLTRVSVIENLPEFSASLLESFRKFPQFKFQSSVTCLF